MLREQNEGAVFVFDLDQHGVGAAAAFPTCIDEECRVRWAAGERGLQILPNSDQFGSTGKSRGRLRVPARRSEYRADIKTLSFSCSTRQLAVYK